MSPFPPATASNQWQRRREERAAIVVVLPPFLRSLEFASCKKEKKSNTAAAAEAKEGAFPSSLLQNVLLQSPNCRRCFQSQKKGGGRRAVKDKSLREGERERVKITHLHQKRYSFSPRSDYPTVQIQRTTDRPATVIFRSLFFAFGGVFNRSRLDSFFSFIPSSFFALSL